MSDPHKPDTPGPWEWQEVSVHVRDYALIRSIDGRYVAEVRAGSGEADAAAIADLWWWIGRAERYERVLRALANDPETDARGYARMVLEQEGRL